MEDKFTSTEILDYINNKLEKDVSLTKKLALYTQATEKQLDDSIASLRIWLNYIKILQECEYDEIDIREMFKILVKKFFCYFEFWKEFLDFEIIFQNHIKVVEKYEKWIVLKSFEEREKVLNLFAKIKNSGVEEGNVCFNTSRSHNKTGSSRTYGLGTIRTPKNTTNGRIYTMKLNDDKENNTNQGIYKNDEFSFNSLKKVQNSSNQEVPQFKNFYNQNSIPLENINGFSNEEFSSKFFSTKSKKSSKPVFTLNQLKSVDSPRVRKVKIDLAPANLDENRMLESYRNLTGNKLVSFQGACDVMTEEINKNITQQMRNVFRNSNNHEKIPEARCSGNEILFKNNILTVIKQAGKGGGGVVYQVLYNSEIYALKKVKLPSDRETVLQGYLNEISLLEKLRGFEEIIFLHDYEITDRYLLILMEYGETDLSFILKKNKQGIDSANYINYLWEQVLKAVHRIHQNRIIHRDLKPANFLMVQGRVKLIDFGIAKTIRNDTTHINIESQVGTINYMAPEAFDQERRKLGRSSDIWSLGCILYEMVYGRPPLDKFTNALHKIKNLQDENYEIEYPERKSKYRPIIATIKRCLIRDQTERINIEQLLIAGIECDDKIVLERKDLKTLTKAVLNIKKNSNLNPNLVANSIVDEFLRKIKK